MEVASLPFFGIIGCVDCAEISAAAVSAAGVCVFCSKNCVSGSGQIEKAWQSFSCVIVRKDVPADGILCVFISGSSIFFRGFCKTLPADKKAFGKYWDLSVLDGVVFRRVLRKL